MLRDRYYPKTDPNDFKQQFDARVADALLLKAGVTNAADRHIHGVVLRRAIDEAAA